MSYKKIIILVSITALLFSSLSFTTVRSTMAANLSWGSQGGEVVQLQSTLNSKGFWCGAADGIFGPNTYQAVINFQKSAVLPADGIVGPNTRAALGGTLASTPQVSRGGQSDFLKYPKLSKANGRFGQFRYRELWNGQIEVDPVWTANNIITIRLPGLNRNVQVHRLAAEQFTKAFNYIKNGTAVVNGRQVSLLGLVWTMDGTYVTRHVNWNPAKGLSNHSWGTAIDLNASNHFRYVNSWERSDPNMILWEKAFKPAGFNWGNSYADAMHYELLR